MQKNGTTIINSSQENQMGILGLEEAVPYVMSENYAIVIVSDYVLDELLYVL